MTHEAGASFEQSELKRLLEALRREEEVLRQRQTSGGSLGERVEAVADRQDELSLLDQATDTAVQQLDFTWAHNAPLGETYVSPMASSEASPGVHDAGTASGQPEASEISIAVAAANAGRGAAGAGKTATGGRIWSRAVAAFAILLSIPTGYIGYEYLRATDTQQQPLDPLSIDGQLMPRSDRTIEASSGAFELPNLIASRRSKAAATGGFDTVAYHPRAPKAMFARSTPEAEQVPALINDVVDAGMPSAPTLTTSLAIVARPGQPARFPIGVEHRNKIIGTGLVVVRGLPETTRYSAGFALGDGGWGILPENLAGLTIELPKNSAANYTAKVNLLTTDQSQEASGRIAIRVMHSAATPAASAARSPIVPAVDAAPALPTKVVTGRNVRIPLPKPTPLRLMHGEALARASLNTLQNTTTAVLGNSATGQIKPIEPKPLARLAQQNVPTRLTPRAAPQPKLRLRGPSVAKPKLPAARPALTKRRGTEAQSAVKKAVGTAAKKQTPKKVAAVRKAQPAKAAKTTTNVTAPRRAKPKYGELSWDPFRTE